MGSTGMLGAIAGDIIGSRFEGHTGAPRDFTLFHPACRFTDDTLACIAERWPNRSMAFPVTSPTALEAISRTTCGWFWSGSSQRCAREFQAYT
jgi:hypothetical protein